MTRKTAAAYEAVLTAFRNLIPMNQIDTILGDFELGLRLGARASFPNAHIAGCSVHYERVNLL